MGFLKLKYISEKDQNFFLKTMSGEEKNLTSYPLGK